MTNLGVGASTSATTGPSSTSISVGKPSGAVAGDLLLFNGWIYDPSSDGNVLTGAPTNIQFYFSGPVGNPVKWLGGSLFCGPSEPATYTFSYATPASAEMHCTRVPNQGLSQTNPVPNGAAFNSSPVSPYSGWTPAMPPGLVNPTDLSVCLGRNGGFSSAAPTISGSGWTTVYNTNLAITDSANTIAERRGVSLAYANGPGSGPAYSDGNNSDIVSVASLTVATVRAVPSQVIATFYAPRVGKGFYCGQKFRASDMTGASSGQMLRAVDNPAGLGVVGQPLKASQA